MRHMPLQHARDWVDFLEAIGPLVAVLVAIGVGLTQSYLQRQQLKQDLFEKRFAIYAFVKEYLTGAVLGDRELNPNFVNKTRPAEFLFGPEVLTFIDEAHTLAMTLASHREEDDEWAEATLKGVERTAYDEFERVFRPYLQLHQEESWIARLMARLNRWIDQEVPAAMAARSSR
jgi:hypothetical protein